MAQLEIFRQLLDTDDFAGAWLSLNSPGWRFGEARSAIKLLSAKVPDPEFAVLADAWSSLPHERRMGDTY
jgi:hypothetical protein